MHLGDVAVKKGLHATGCRRNPSESVHLGDAVKKYFQNPDAPGWCSAEIL
jgi:hypothetical protein